MPKVLNQYQWLLSMYQLLCEYYLCSVIESMGDIWQCIVLFQLKFTMLLFAYFQMYWWVVVIVSLVLIGVMALIMFLCNLITPTDNPWKEEVHNARRNRVSLRTRRDRGSQYPRSAPRNDDKTITAFQYGVISVNSTYEFDEMKLFYFHFFFLLLLKYSPVWNKFLGC